MADPRVRAGYVPAILTLALLTTAPGDGKEPDRVQEEASPSEDSRAAGEEATDEEEASTTKGGTDDEETGPLQIYEQVTVQERVDDMVGIATSSSEGSTGRRALRARPIQRAGEVVETVPGLIATQHSGDGKANQYFLRGFNLDHGTDFSVTVAGVPVNMPSHGHGQGYSDLNFLIPELIDSVHFRKGTGSVQAGDFSAAGSAKIDLAPRLERRFINATVGSDSYARAVAGASTQMGEGFLTAALELHGNDGPWERPNQYERFNGFLRYYSGSASRGWSLTAMGHEGSWLSSDQIPERAVEQDLVGRFGLLDTGPRGETKRYSLSGEIRRGSATSLSRLNAYAMRYEFGLTSNFTYFLDHPERGDQFEQTDERWVGGLDASHLWSTTLGNLPAEWSVGFQARFDDIDNGLFRTRDRERFATTRRDTIRQWGAGVYGEMAVRWNDAVRTTLGLRLDGYRARVASGDLATNSGSSDDLLASPKLSVAWRLHPDTELYGSFGYGFHSNDARGTTIRVDPVTGADTEAVRPLVRGTGGELGIRTSVLPGLQSTLTVYALELDSELVFVGDAGGTEANRPSRRVGVEWTNAWQLRPWLTLDLDAAWVDARFTDDAAGDEIPGAVDGVVTGGLTVDRTPWSGAVRARAFSGYPLTEDGSIRASSTTLVNGRVAYAFASGWQLALEGFNLLDREDNDVEYFYASRLPGEPLEGVEDVHFHPVEPRSFRLGLSWRF